MSKLNYLHKVINQSLKDGEVSTYEEVILDGPKGITIKMYSKDKKGVKTTKTLKNKEILLEPVTNLELSVRSRKCLTMLKVETVSDLLQKTEEELLKCKNFGNTSLLEIKKKISELGLSLKQP